LAAAIGTPTTPDVRGGDPAREILAAAEEHGADLIVTGSRGLDGLDRLLLGSVAGDVLKPGRSSPEGSRSADQASGRATGDWQRLEVSWTPAVDRASVVHLAFRGNREQTSANGTGTAFVRRAWTP